MPTSGCQKGDELISNGFKVMSCAFDQVLGVASLYAFGSYFFFSVHLSEADRGTLRSTHVCTVLGSAEFSGQKVLQTGKTLVATMMYQHLCGSRTVKCKLSK